MRARSLARSPDRGGGITYEEVGEREGGCFECSFRVKETVNRSIAGVAGEETGKEKKRGKKGEFGREGERKRERDYGRERMRQPASQWRREKLG